MSTATASLVCPDAPVVRDDLERKFTWLLRLRDEASRGLKPTKAELQALAAAFPGALREIDDTPLDDLAARLEQLKTSDALPVWANAVWLYHGVLRTHLAAARDGVRPQGGLVDLALRQVAVALSMSEGDVAALVIPHAKRRSRLERTNGGPR